MIFFDPRLSFNSVQSTLHLRIECSEVGVMFASSACSSIIANRIFGKHRNQAMA